MIGVAYVFRKMNKNELRLGHVGWGILLSHEHYCYGGIEKIQCNGETEYHCWFEFGPSDKMLMLMRRLNYVDYKGIRIREPHIERGRLTGIEPLSIHFPIRHNIPLKKVSSVLEAYGVQGLPWEVDCSCPNEWFNRLSGEYFKL